MSDDLKLPDEIMVWRGQEMPWTGTWSTTRYPDDAVAYVPRTRIGALTAEVARLTAETETLTRSGIIEVAVRNPNVMSYIQHWEARAEAAEAKLSQGADEALERAAVKIEVDSWPTFGDSQKIAAAIRAMKGTMK